MAEQMQGSVARDGREIGWRSVGAGAPLLLLNGYGGTAADWDPNFHDRPRILGVPLTGGAGEYRLRAPLRRDLRVKERRDDAPGLLVLEPVEERPRDAEARRDDAARVAQVEEGDTAVIAPARHPPS